MVGPLTNPIISQISFSMTSHFGTLSCCHHFSQTLHYCNLKKKTADISRPYNWFPHKMTSEKRPQKLHTNDVLVLRSGQCFWLAEVSFPRGTTNQKHHPDLDSDTSSVWNFWSRSSDVIWRETSGAVAKCRLFSQAGIFVVPLRFL